MDENVIDAEFTEMNIKGDKNIRYSATQVAEIFVHFIENSMSYSVFIIIVFV